MANARHTVLFLHGNAGNISHRLDTLALLARLETSVLIVDYRGYGESTGKPSEAGSYLDADAAWDYLTAERGIDPAQIVVFGRSLGGAVAIALAARRPAAALIVEAGFTSVPDLAARLYPWLPVRWLARIHYPSRQRIASIGCPLLLLHSRDDEIVPFSHARALFEAAVPPRTLVALRGGHNDAFMVSATRYSDALRQFLDGL